MPASVRWGDSAVGMPDRCVPAATIACASGCVAPVLRSPPALPVQPADVAADECRHPWLYHGQRTGFIVRLFRGYGPAVPALRRLLINARRRAAAASFRSKVRPRVEITSAHVQTDEQSSVSPL